MKKYHISPERLKASSLLFSILISSLLCYIGIRIAEYFGADFSDALSTASFIKSVFVIGIVLFFSMFLHKQILSKFDS